VQYYRLQTKVKRQPSTQWALVLVNLVCLGGLLYVLLLPFI